MALIIVCEMNNMVRACQIKRTVQGCDLLKTTTRRIKWIGSNSAPLLCSFGLCNYKKNYTNLKVTRPTHTNYIHSVVIAVGTMWHMLCFL